MEKDLEVISKSIGFDKSDFKLRLSLLDLKPEHTRSFSKFSLEDKDIESSARNILNYMLSFHSLKKLFPEDKTEMIIQRYKNYIKSLLNPELDIKEGISALRAGIVHENYGVLPKYYVNLYSKFLEETVNLLNRNGYKITKEEYMTLSKRMLLHISLALDSYFFKKDEEIIKLKRLYNVLSKINMLIFKANNMDLLFSETVRILVDIGKFDAACIGKYNPDSNIIEPVFLYERKPVIENRLGKFRFGLGINEVEIKSVEDIPEKHIWKRILRSSGISSIGIVPIFNSLNPEKSDIEYILTIYSTELERFSQKDVELLKELSVNLSFAVEKLKQTMIDNITLLPNRNLFIKELGKSILDNEKDNKNFAVVLLDIDDFKIINEQYGYYTGDIILRKIASRLKKELRTVDYIARIGGDEFGIILRDIQSEKDVVNTIERIRRAFSHPFYVNSGEFLISFSAGVSIFPIDGKVAEKLIISSEIALEKAKTRKSMFYFYKSELSKRTFEIITLENQLKEAVSNKEFLIYYQPQIDLKKKNIIGVEALLRWKKGNKFIPPVKFIEVLENTGMIVDVGKWILKEICKQIKKWEKKGLNLKVAVNISTVQLESEDFVSSVRNILRRTKCKASKFEFEITETAFVKSIEHSANVLKALNRMGIKISIDDFGTGYSSLLYLKKFPISSIKIDREFIKDILQDKDDETIVKSIISLAKNFGIKTVAEGVETKEQLNILTFLGCSYIQGYLFLPPVPAEEIENFYRDFKYKNYL